MWRDEARAWVRDLFPTSRIFTFEAHRDRVWGSIWKLGVDDGLYWFKRGHPVLWREVRLRRLLTRLAPDHVLPVVADDPDRGWMLTADQGPTLAARARQEGAHHYVELAAALGQVQRTLGHHPDLQGIGLASFAPADAVGRLDDMLARFDALPTGHPAHISPAQRTSAVKAMATVVQRWEAVGAGLPDLGLDHNDLHAGNAFPGPLISDWGDAVLGHPFCSLRPLLHAATTVFGPGPGRAVRRAYLAQWGEPDELDEALEVAMLLAVPQRLHCWQALRSEEAMAEFAGYIVPLWEEVGRPVGRLTQP